MSFLRTRDFLFFRKMENKSLLGVYFSSSQNGENWGIHRNGENIEIFEDLCLAYSDSALSYVTVYG
jgi:hypothetical protein